MDAATRPAPLRICLIGTGSMLKDCLVIARQLPATVVCRVLLRAQPDGWHESVQAFCEQQGVAPLVYGRLREPAVESTIGDEKPDLLVSVNNPDVIPARILGLAAMGINFHPAPLPRYAGLNSCSWALLHGETRYAVTWHLLAPEIDAGDIVAQETFRIEESWGAGELLTRCHALGSEMFGEVLARIVAGPIRSHAQDLTQRSYFGGAMKPFGGNFPFHASAGTLANLQRATAYFPGPNPFYMPKVTIRGVSFELVRFNVQPGPPGAPEGTLVHVGETDLGFAVSGGTMHTDIVQSVDGRQWVAEEFAWSEGLAIGDQAELDPQPYTAAGLALT